MVDKKKYREGTFEEINQVWQEVNLWYTHSGRRWSDTQFVALSAIAEFVANNRGFSVYTNEG